MESVDAVREVLEAELNGVSSTLRSRAQVPALRCSSSPTACRSCGSIERLPVVQNI